MCMLCFVSSLSPLKRSIASLLRNQMSSTKMSFVSLTSAFCLFLEKAVLEKLVYTHLHTCNNIEH